MSLQRLLNIHNQDDLTFALSIIFKRIKQRILKILFTYKIWGSAIEIFKYQLPAGTWYLKILILFTTNFEKWWFLIVTKWEMWFFS